MDSRRKLFNLMKLKQFSTTAYSSTETDDNIQEPTISDDPKRIQTKILNEKKKERKEKRDKLVNANRDRWIDLTIESVENETILQEQPKTQSNQSSTASVNQELSTTYLVGSSISSNNTNKNNYSTASERNVSKSSSATTTSTTDFHFARPTFISNTRRQLIELWRKQKKEEEALKDKRPPFKVYHLDSKILDYPNLPQSSTFNFKMSINTSSKSSNNDFSSHHHRPITRSHTRRDLAKPPVPAKSDFFSKIKIDILNNACSSSLKSFKTNTPKSSSTSSLSSKQFMPLPPPPINIEPINASLKPTKIEKDVELITNRIDNSVFITRQDHFRPSLSSTILHCDLNETSNQNKNNINLPTIIESFDSIKTIHKEIEIINKDTNDKHDDLVIKIDQKIHSQSIVLNNDDVNVVMEIQSDMIYDNNKKEIEHIQLPEIESNTADLEKQIPIVITSVPQTIDDELAEIKTLLNELDERQIENRDTLYYRELVKAQTINLNCLSTKYLAYCDDKVTIVPDDIQGDIRSACGLAKLLIDERFNQFIELIDQCEHTNSAEIQQSDDIKLVKCSDLQGFWDMVDFQIKDVEKKFNVIEKLKENNYQKEFVLISKPQVKKTKPKPTENNTNNAISKPAVQSKFAQFRAKLKQQSTGAPAAANIIENDIKIDIVEVKDVKEEIKVTNLVKLHDSVHSTPTPTISINGNELLTSILRKSAVKCSAQREILTSGSINDSHSGSATHNLDHPPKRYNLRSRPSDLIKFESPCSLCTPPVRKTLSRKSLSTVKKTPGNLLNNKENLDVCDEEEDMFSFQNEKVITWKVNRNNEQDADNSTLSHNNTNKLLLDVSNSNSNKLSINNFRKSISNIHSNNTPIRTPIRRTTSGRDSLNPGQISSVINSPLLKLAYISSHGKRLSISANK